MILAWMAVTSAILNKGGLASDVACSIAQVAILFSGMLEVGTVETGKDSRFRLPSRIMAVASYLASLTVSFIASHP